MMTSSHINAARVTNTEYPKGSYVARVITKYVSPTILLLNVKRTAINQKYDAFDGIEREEGAEDKSRLAVHCPDTKDHPHCITPRP